MVVELVYDAGCPNVDTARAILTRALQESGVPAVWTEWDTADDDCPETLKGLGSPTILVNGEDVAPGPHPWAAREAVTAPRCRLYREGTELTGAPSLSNVVAAVQAAMRPDVV